MYRKVFILALLIWGIGLFAVETAYVPGEIMIQFSSHQESTLASIESNMKNIDLQRVRLLSKRMNIWLFSFETGITSDKMVKLQINKNSEVIASQFNHYTSKREIIPDDSSFDLQWNMYNTGQQSGVIDADIDATNAWELNSGGVTVLGDTLVIAIIDGGCDLNHDDLNFYKNENEIPNNGLDDDDNGYVDDYDGWNAYAHTGFIPTDSHGTHVSGIAGAIGDNNLGVAGVNWNAKIMPIAGESSVESVVVEAYGYVLEMRQLWNETNGDQGAFVISTNASFGVDFGNPANYPLWSAIYDSLGVAGVLNAAATMNSHQNIDVVNDMPTACDSDYLITVTNTTNMDVKHSMAGYGLTTIDLGAPGASVYSTNMNNAYTFKTGTSMASPHVAGAVAYLFSAVSAEFLLEYAENPAEKCLEIKQIILDGVDPLPDLNGITVSGGRLNLYNSLDLILNPVTAQDNLISPQIELSNYPNPFNPSTTISFSVSSELSENTELIIYNLKGQKIKDLSLKCNNHVVATSSSSCRMYFTTWNGTNNSSQPVSSGIYFVKLKSGRHTASKKMLLMK